MNDAAVEGVVAQHRYKQRHLAALAVKFTSDWRLYLTHVGRRCKKWCRDIVSKRREANVSQETPAD
jgi:hypothetical protein